MTQLLAAVRVTALTTNLPGPLAAARLRALGATITKIEPLGGDPLQAASSVWYARLCASLEVVRLDLKSAAGRERVEAELSCADVLLTTMRIGALADIGLDWETLQARFPRLSHIAVVGEPTPYGDRVGHDLTHQARAGLIAPPRLPTSGLRRRCRRELRDGGAGGALPARAYRPGELRRGRDRRCRAALRGCGALRSHRPRRSAGRWPLDVRALSERGWLDRAGGARTAPMPPGCVSDLPGARPRIGRKSLISTTFRSQRYSNSRAWDARG